MLFSLVTIVTYCIMSLVCTMPSVCIATMVTCHSVSVSSLTMCCQCLHPVAIYHLSALPQQGGRPWRDVCST